MCSQACTDNGLHNSQVRQQPDLDHPVAAKSSKHTVIHACQVAKHRTDDVLGRHWLCRQARHAPGIAQITPHTDGVTVVVSKEQVSPKEHTIASKQLVRGMFPLSSQDW